MSAELWFHIIEILVLLFGIALPMVWGVLRIVSLLKDFPPHRHLNGKIVYPSGYRPTEAEILKS